MCGDRRLNKIYLLHSTLIVLICMRRYTVYKIVYKIIHYTTVRTVVIIENTDNNVNNDTKEINVIIIVVF